MKHYELLTLVSGKYAEHELEPITTMIDETLRKHGALIQFTTSWGRRKLAYPIDHTFYGYYILTEFDCDPAAMQQVNRELELSNEIMRHHIAIKVPGQAPMIPFGGARETLSVGPRERERPSYGNPPESAKTVQGAVDQVVTEASAELEQKPKEPVVAAAEVENTSVNAEELNKKLDEILNNDII